MVYSRFGTRQWAGPLPWTRVVVKDPYALLSMPAVAAATGATPVLVYRHPGAVLASYRRVGWQPRFDEVASIVAEEKGEQTRALGLELPAGSVGNEPVTARDMGVFWSVLHELALADVASSGAVVVSHAELAAGGEEAGRALADRLHLRWSAAMAAEFTKESSRATVSARLHNFDRAPAAVAEEWRTQLEDGETDAIEQVSAATLAKVEAARFRLT